MTDRVSLHLCVLMWQLNEVIQKKEKKPKTLKDKLEKKKKEVGVLMLMFVCLLCPSSVSVSYTKRETTQDVKVTAK